MASAATNKKKVLVTDTFSPGALAVLRERSDIETLTFSNLITKEDFNAFLKQHGAQETLPRINEAKGPDILLTRAQRDRVERLYADDFDLYDDLLAQRERRLQRPAAGAAVM